MDHEDSTGIAVLIKKLKRKVFFKDLLTRNSLNQFSRYIVIGLLSFFIEYSLFFLLLQVFRIWFVFSNIAVYALVFWFNFLFNRLWSFRSKFDLKKQLLRYALLFFFNLALTTTILYLLTDMFGISPLISKAVVMCLIVPWNFILYKKVIYK